jgi:hypothetical protein
VINKQIRPVPPLEFPSLVEATKLRLCAVWNFAKLEFYLQALLIDFFRHSVVAVVVNFKRRAHESVSLLPVNIGFHHQRR